mmetsp:Transcript_91393/g.212568  ORF Transcript_91393/g.212568 Transcript_91393/m.212568 type:complete len:342 (+) Transcript_91393:77-1102(+)
MLRFLCVPGSPVCHCLKTRRRCGLPRWAQKAAPPQLSRTAGRTGRTVSACGEPAAAAPVPLGGWRCRGEPSTSSAASQPRSAEQALARWTGRPPAASMPLALARGALKLAAPTQLTGSNHRNPDAAPVPSPQDSQGCEHPWAAVHWDATPTALLPASLSAATRASAPARSPAGQAQSWGGSRKPPRPGAWPTAPPPLAPRRWAVASCGQRRSALAQQAPRLVTAAPQQSSASPSAPVRRATACRSHQVRARAAPAHHAQGAQQWRAPTAATPRRRKRRFLRLRPRWATPASSLERALATGVSGATRRGWPKRRPRHSRPNRWHPWATPSHRLPALRATPLV